MIYKNEEITNANLKSKNKIFSTTVLLVVYTLLVILIYNAFLILYSANTKEQNYIFGMKAFTIETSSMEPTLKIGDVVIVKKVESSDLEVGDIITFRNSNGELVTHRIAQIDYENKVFTTKGDKNNINDIELVTYDNIEGIKIFKISNFSSISSGVKICLYLGLIIIIIITVFLHNRREHRKKMLRRRKKKDEDKKIREAESNNSKTN